jgi:hypothetical protein
MASHLEGALQVFRNLIARGVIGNAVDTTIVLLKIFRQSNQINQDIIQAYIDFSRNDFQTLVQSQNHVVRTLRNGEANNNRKLVLLQEFS